VLPHSLKFEEQPQTVLGRKALGLEAPHDGEVGVHSDRGVVIQIFEKLKCFGGSNVVIDGWLHDTMVQGPIPEGHIVGELDSRSSM